MALSGLFRGRRAGAARADEPLASAVRLCTDYLVAVGSAPSGRNQTADRPNGGHRDADAPGVALPTPGLSSAIGCLLAAAVASDGPRPSNEAFDALLTAAERALEAGGPDQLRLALDLADTAVAIRDRSKGAWRLRGLALEELGRGAEAIEAYERHLALEGDAGPSHPIVLRLATLREMRRCVDEAAGLFPSGTIHPIGDTAGLGSEPLRAAFTSYAGERLAERGAGDPAVRRLAELYATYRRLEAQGRMADPLLAASAGEDGETGEAGEPVGVSAFRNLIAGRSVCLFAGTEQVEEGQPAHDLDGYDLVVRFDAYRSSRPGGPGERVDIHAVTLRGERPWEGPRWSRTVPIRLVFGHQPDAWPWRQALRSRLVPGAQRYFGDASLRRPLSDPALLGDGGPGADGSATTAFTMIRLLDFLDVSSRIDVVGFGLPGRLRPEERRWVAQRAAEIGGSDPTGMRTSLR